MWKEFGWRVASRSLCDLTLRQKSYRGCLAEDTFGAFLCSLHTRSEDISRNRSIVVENIGCVGHRYMVGSPVRLVRGLILFRPGLR